MQALVFWERAYYPIPQGEKYEQRVKSFSKDFKNGQTRIKLKFGDGTNVEYLVVNSLTEFTVGKAKANAEGLLLMTSPGAVQGLSMSRFNKKLCFPVVR